MRNITRFPGSYLDVSDQRIDSHKRFCAIDFFGRGGGLPHLHSFVVSSLSVHLSSLNNSFPTGRIFMKFYVCGILLKSEEIVEISLISGSNGYFTLRPMYNYVGYSSSKYRLRISRAHPRDCHFAHVQ